MGKPIRDLTSQTFGRWTAIRKVNKPLGCSQTGQYWLFKCKCGNEKVLRGASVARNGGSCGCLKSELSSVAMSKMQLIKHGTIEDRFLSRFNKTKSGCWIWTAHSDKDGYGIIPGNNSNTRAHRYSFEYYIEPIKKGNVVCHTCDTPSCVNPDHLFQGTTKDNCTDMISKNRDKMIGSRNNKAKLTESDIPEIRYSNESYSVIAEKYGVSVSTIKRIKRYKQWRHVE